MEMISVADTKARLSELLGRVEEGEEVVITRRGKPVARLSAIQQPKKPVVSLADFRRKLPRQDLSASEILRRLREESL